MDIRKIDLDKWYSLTEMAALRPLPVNNNRETLARLVDEDINGANLLQTERIPWKIKGKYTYRIQGRHIIHYIAMKGWNNGNSKNT